MPHSWVAALLVGLLIGSAIATSASSRWGDPIGALFGEFGVVTVLTGVVTVFFLGYRAVVGHLALLNTQKTLEHSQRAEIAVRYQKGMEMLASSHESTRIGGLYLLRDVIIALPEVYWPSVSDSLFPFIRHSCAPLAQEFGRYMQMIETDDDPEEHSAWLETTPPDVIVALRILGRGWPELKESTKEQPMAVRTLRGLVLANVKLHSLSFEGITFQDVIIQGTTISDSSLQGCSITTPATNTRFENCVVISCDIFIKFSPHGPGNVAFNKCVLRDASIDGSPLSQLSITACDTQNVKITHPNASFFDD